MEAELSKKSLFTTVDYAMFVSLIVVSLIIGVLAGMKGFKKATPKDFFVGGRKLHIIPVSMSLVGGVISALSVLGNPTEMYLHGTQLWVNLLGCFWGVFIIIFLLLPVLYPLDLISMMKYIEMRFDSPLLKKLGSLSQLLNVSLFLGICLYTPSLALSSATDLPKWVTIVVLGLVCTVYISIGGVKAVVYTDVFQTLIMFIGILAVVIQVCIDLEGVGNVVEAAAEGGRLEFFNFDPSPFVRHTFWSVQVLGAYFIVSSVGISQGQFQRLVSVKSLRSSQWLLVIFFFGLVVLWSLFNFSGLTAYAAYKDCDPLKSEKIKTADEIIPYLVVDKLNHLPGMAGLFVAAVYGAVLSSVSSQASAFAALVWEDFLQNWLWFSQTFRCSPTNITRIISAVAGLLGIAFAFLVESLGTLFQASYSISGAVVSPLDGLFIVGIAAPWVNKKGAICGFLSAFIFNMFLVSAKFIYKPQQEPLPLSIAGCSANDTYSLAISGEGNFSMPIEERLFTTTGHPGDLEDDVTHRSHSLYDISYCYLGTIGVMIVYVVGTIVSLITGVQNPKYMNEALISKSVMRFYKWIWRVTHKTEASDEVEMKCIHN